MAQQSERVLATPALISSAAIGDAGRRLWRFTKRNPTMMAGMAVVVIIVLLAIFASMLWTQDPIRPKPLNRFISPGSEHWFGTDNIGRDVYSRTIYGSRISIIVGSAVALISILSASVIGLLAGYYRRLDAIIMRFMDGLMSIPSVLLAMALMALLGGSVQNVIIALCVVETPRAVRIVRSAVLSIREQMYVDAARALGIPPWRILALHIYPNTFAPLIVQATYIAALAVLAETYLSFLGVGAPPEIPTWGNGMAEGRNFISRAVWIIFFPYLFLSLTILAINLAGDSLRDNLDPKLRRRM